jgi:hypothetical protein
MNKDCENCKDNTCFWKNELEFDDRYKMFIEKLTYNEYLNFEREFNGIMKLYDSLCQKFNEIVAERLSNSAKETFIKDQINLAIEGNLNLLELLDGSQKYNISLSEFKKIFDKSKSKN